MKPRRLLFDALVLFSLVVVYATHVKADNATDPGIARTCDSVDYVVNATNDGRRVDDSTWPTADSMNDPRYWTLTATPRYLTDSPLNGDVIVMKANAVVMPWNQATRWWDDYFSKNSLGHGDGHIGIVTAAQYWDYYQGWMILIRSAGWSEEWGTYFDGNGCSNVSESFVFVPNGADVTFWRAS